MPTAARPTAARHSDELARHCVELLSGIGTPRARRMFGGHGLYVDELFVAIVTGERLYLKADEQTRARFEAEGCEPFTYEAAGRRRVTLGYFAAPEQAMDSPALMQPWARLALEAALRARAAKARARPRSPASASPARKARARSMRA